MKRWQRCERMPQANKMHTALLSSYKKDESLLRLARILTTHGWKLLGSAGTVSFLADNGVPAKDIGDIVGKPILGHRVVTLSREIYAGLLAHTDADFEELKRLNITPIDLVYVILYPLEETIAQYRDLRNPDIDRAKADTAVLEKTDIGGPTLLRAASKGRRIVISDPAQIETIEKWLENDERHDEKMLLRLAAAAERRVADYVAGSAAYWERQR